MADPYDVLVATAISVWRHGGRIRESVIIPELLADLMKARLGGRQTEFDEWLSCSDRDAIRAVDSTGKTIAVITGPEMEDCRLGLPLGTTQPAVEARNADVSDSVGKDGGAHGG
jgi:hypothetical protein